MTQEKDNLPTLSTKDDFVLYTTEAGDVRLQVQLHEETLWLNQKSMATLFDDDVRTINEHLKNIYKSLELNEKSTIRNFRIVQIEGDRQVQRSIDFYNLDVIIAVGYRVNSKRATQFRIWATDILKQYIVKGFAMDDARLKQGQQVFGKDYFQELLERVRSIRASERRIYQQITDIFAECSMDYDPESEITQNFFAEVQNKFHYAMTGHTAAELIHERADQSKENMGLQTWKNAPKGRILKSDVLVAKNYLDEKDLKKLERTVSGFFDYIENIIENKQTFTMVEFAQSVDKFLNFNEYKILEGKGKISKDQASQKAISEYQHFNKSQPIESDFDKVTKKLLKKLKK